MVVWLLSNALYGPGKISSRITKLEGTYSA